MLQNYYVDIRGYCLWQVGAENHQIIKIWGPVGPD